MTGAAAWVREQQLSFQFKVPIHTEGLLLPVPLCIFFNEATAILRARMLVSSIIEQLRKDSSARSFAYTCGQESKIRAAHAGAGCLRTLRRCARHRQPGAVVEQGRTLLDLVELAAACGNAAAMTGLSDVLQLRVRYSETDQMGTFYNSRALEWFECGRTELMRRRLGMSYAALEARGVFLPLVEAHLEFLGGRATTICLNIASSVEMSGRARLRFEVQIQQRESRKPVVRGYTVHAFTDRQGKPIRPPAWFIEMLAGARGGCGNGQG